MSIASTRPGGGPLDLIEEAYHLIRRLPLGILTLYYLGAVPFVLVFLFFWADLSQGTVSPQRVATAALGAAGAYLWMKFWQTVFAGRVREWMTGDERQKWTLGRAWRVLAGQAFLQPAGLLLKPLSFVVPFLFVVPVFSFFSLLTVDGARDTGVRELASRALGQCLFRAREIYAVIFLLLFFGVFFLINIATLIAVVPYLLQVLFAIDTEFMRTGWSEGNSTFFISALGLTYLGLDPLLKGLFILRSYYLDARTTGEDLRVGLKRATAPKASGSPVAALLLLAFLIGCAMPASAGANEEADSRTEAAFSSGELDEKMDEVLSQREYLWRLPRPDVEDEGERGLLGHFADAVGEWIAEIWEGIGRTAGSVVEWLFSLFFGGGREPSYDRSPRDWAQGLQIAVVILGAGLVFLTGLILWQAWRKRKRTATAAAVPTLQLRPDLEDENVTADALPVDEWTRLAAEHKAKGEFRLALRAYYLASLAALAEAQLLILGRAKSNREYRDELSRRAHDQPSRLQAFGDNCRLYERVWYGMYPVDGDLLANFERNQERIKHHEEIIAR